MPTAINTPVTITLSDATEVLAAWDGSRGIVPGYPEHCPIVVLPSNSYDAPVAITHAAVQGVDSDLTNARLFLLPGVSRPVVLPFTVPLAVVAAPISPVYVDPNPPAP